MENNYKFIAILNKKIEFGRLLNALGHMTAGLVGGYEKTADMNFLMYEDKDATVHPNISYYPFIVSKADNSNQIRTVRDEAIARGIAFTDFTNTMVVGTSEEQLETTAKTAEKDLEYYGVCLFGKAEDLREFTKKFSLFQ